MNADLEQVLGDIAAEQMEQMTAAQQEFSKRMAEQHQVVDNSANRILERFTRRRPQQTEQVKKYNPEIEKIADFLTAFPKLIPVVANVIQQVTTAMETAFDNVAAQYNSTSTQQTTQTQTQSGGTSNG